MKTYVYPLKGKIQNYAWGGNSFIPQLLDFSAEENTPYAEYWMGAHDKAPSVLSTQNGETNLNDFIQTDANTILGDVIAKRFDNKLPFLFKVLDVKQMLSIQVHPTKEEAVKGFARENEEGIPLSASHRNYKDDNHKPEIMVALTDFWLLHGFRNEQSLREILEIYDVFKPLIPVFESGNYKALYQYVMEMPQEEVDTMLQPLIDHLLPLYEAGKLEKHSPNYWAAKAAVEMSQGNHLDRGIFSIYFYNLVKAKKGEAVFQDAGIPHAYLEGVNMELMANSDNVLRGGLTPKHVDVPELLKHVTFEAVTPNLLEGENISDYERVYKSPAPDFELSRITLPSASTYKSVEKHAAEIIIAIEGDVTVKTDTDEFKIEKGEAFFASADAAYSIDADQESLLFRATAPLN
ncbi:mannose-6-phosphate isomerase, class I [Sediminitomix flava]|uniref:mannose-6-phosphate isomerase n=1 Tax=Sediminitomix flava TaxID=379075 RepID=A0A315YWD8_SEDFL|nr:mannose-6-phosphate isomerase, class I [Sediminitomix flava]PWJ34169.1 mannose-6-phosphate isomerase type 1 [Sediminitomix flava]